ncbi:hypothetical protein NEILACOT_05750, partial [Neisseria lactamica ATCC 23970]
SAVNAAAPYASEAIGRTFGHGENKNETAQAVGHFLLGAAIARVNGGNFAAGGSAAVAAEKQRNILPNGITTVKPQSIRKQASSMPTCCRNISKKKSNRRSG